MRIGMLDVGSNTVHLLIVDSHPGAPPQPASKQRTDLRLIDFIDDAGRLSEEGVTRLVRDLEQARDHAHELGVDELLAFATSALRDATNSEEVVARVAASTDVRLEVLRGDAEARLTFLAARRWFGWSAGRLLVVDVGGGSLEVAAGMEELPELAASLPLGASRLSRNWLRRSPPTAHELDALRRHVKKTLKGGLAEPAELGRAADHAVGTSKTLRSLARIAGASPYRDGPYVRRSLTRAQAEVILDRVAGMGPKSLLKLPGVSESRALSLIAGALVAVTALEVLDIAELEICPWALREGVILTHAERLQYV